MGSRLGGFLVRNDPLDVVRCLERGGKYTGRDVLRIALPLYNMKNTQATRHVSTQVSDMFSLVLTHVKVRIIVSIDTLRDRDFDEYPESDEG